jgi:hypothetical protein
MSISKSKKLWLFRAIAIKKITLLAWLCTMNFSVWSQSLDSVFVRHLYEQSLWRESLAFARLSNKISSDRLFFWTAKTLFKCSQYDSAEVFFAKVSPQNPYLYFEAKNWLNFIELAENPIAEKNWPLGFDSASQSLSQKLSLYNNLLANDFTNKQIENHPDLASLCFIRKNFKKKSVFLAATLSTILPGSGKFYAGYSGEGLSALSQCAFLALQALEAYRLNPNWQNNHRLWFFGGVFLVFYSGNIWGSALKIKVRQREFYEQENRRTLELMYIDMDRFFRGAN